MQEWVVNEISSANFGDKRLNKRLGNVLDNLSSKPNASIPLASTSWSETVAAYRFFDNKSVSPDQILLPHKNATISRIQNEKTVLVMQDTSEISYTHREMNIEGMGPLCQDYQQGFYLHPSLAVTPERVSLGTVGAKMYARENLGKKDPNRPFEEKESYRWVQGYEVANEIAEQCPNTFVVNVTDREGDIYEMLMQPAVKGQAYWLTRAAQNRTLLNMKNKETVLEDKLWDRARKAPKVGDIEFDVPATETRKARRVKQAVRARRLCIRPPRRSGSTLPVVEVNIVFCYEKNPPKGEEELQWLLITSVDITNSERAIEVVEWYLCRWQIEIFFKILKSGCEIEELQFENFARMSNCIALYMIIAWRILYITMLGRSCPTMSCDSVLEEAEWKSVYAIVTKKKPPNKVPELNEMIKMIATLGGYLNRKSDREPGPQVMWLGMQRMRDFALGWEVFPRICV